jgi:integrase
VNKFISYLRAAIRLARREGQVRTVPTALRELRLNNARIGFFERDEVERIVAHLKDPVDDVARLGYATGWRESEILGLRWEWVDRQTAVIRLPDSKSGDGRVIPMVGEIEAVLERRWKRRVLGCPWVFHRKGKPVKDFEYAWARARTAAGLPDKLFHDFRRTAARDLIDAGFDLFTSMAITGHKTVQHLQRYKIVDVKRMAEALRGVQRHREKADKRRTLVDSVSGK